MAVNRRRWCEASFLRGCRASTVVAAFALAAAASICRSGDWPVDLAHLRERTEEHFFDGDYEDAMRVLEEVDDWFDNPLNKLNVINMKGDHSMLVAFFTGFRAEVLAAKGEHRRALSAVKLAEKTLKDRRKAYAARGLLPPLLWQYEAFLEFVRGDLLQPIPDFGLADDPTMPAEVQDYFRSRGAGADAMKAYGRAEKVLGDPRTRDEGDFFRRLEGRLLTSLARCKILKAGKPSESDIVDCEALLERAEAAFGRGDFWQSVINQAGWDRLPRTFDEVNKQAADDPTRRLSLKRRFAQTINDWVEIQLLRAELTAYQEQGRAVQAGQAGAMATAEQAYDRIVGFMKSQFGAGHASVNRVKLSRARWLVAQARSPDAKPATRFSLLQDSISDRGGNANLVSSDVLQEQAIELAALSMLLELDKELGRLGAEEKQKYAARVVELKSGLLARVEQ